MATYFKPFANCDLIARNDTFTVNEGVRAFLNPLRNDTSAKGKPHFLTKKGVKAKPGDVVAQVKTKYGTLKLKLDADNKLVFDAGDSLKALKSGQIFKTKFAYTIQDRQGNKAQATIQLNIKGNDAPKVTNLATNFQTQILEALDASAQNVGPISGSLRVTDSDRGDKLKGKIVSTEVSYSGGELPPTANLTALTASNALKIASAKATGKAQILKWTYDPAALDLDFLAAGETLQLVFKVRISDGKSDSSVQTLRFTIVGTNDGATISGASTGTVVEEGADGSQTAAGQLTLTDKDKGEAAFRPVSAAALKGAFGLFAFDAATGAWSYQLDSALAQTLGEGETVQEKLTVVSRDGTASETIVVTVVGRNDGASIGSPTDWQVTEDESPLVLTAAGTISVSDADQNQAAFKNAVAASSDTLGTLTLQPNGQYAYTVDNEKVQYLAEGETKVETFIVETLDGTKKTVSFTIVGTNDGAKITGEAVKTVAEDLNGNAEPIVTSGKLNIVDADAGEAVFQPVDLLDLKAEYGEFTFDSETGEWTFTLDNDKAQTLGEGEIVQQTLTVVSHDGTASETIVVTIVGADDGAVIGAPTDLDVTEDEAPETLIAAGTISVTDADQGEAAFKTAVEASEGSLGTLTLQANGDYSYRVENDKVQYLAEGQTKLESFVIETLDGTKKTVTFTIIGVNDGAAIDGVSAASVHEDGESFVVSGLLNVTDADFGEAAFRAVDGGDLKGQYGDFTFDPQTGAWTYVLDNDKAQALAEGETVKEKLKVVSKDGTAEKTIEVTVVGRNDVPAAADDAFSTKEDQALVLDVADLLANDSFAPDVGETLTIVSVGSATNGTVALDSATGKITFTPAADFNGEASFIYTLSDGKGGESTAKVVIDVEPVNDAPVLTALPQQLAICEDGTLLLPAGSLAEAIKTSPRFDIEDSNLDLVYTVVIKTAGGEVLETFTFNGSSPTDIVFTPPQDFNGELNVEATVTDTGGLSDTVSFPLVVRPVNDAPVLTALPQQLAICEDGTLLLPAGSLAEAIKTSPRFDIEDSNLDLVYTVVIKTAGGEVLETFTFNGSSPTDIVFTPPQDFNGELTVEATVTDTGGRSDTVTFPLVVRPVNDAPVADPASVVGDEDCVIEGRVTATDVDNAAGSLTFAVAPQGHPKHGTVVQNADGTYAYTPAPDFHGSDCFTVIVSDGVGGTSEVVVNVTVKPVNDAPVLSSQSKTASEDDAPVCFDLLEGAEDVDGDTVVLQFVSSVESSDGRVVSFQLNGNLLVIDPAQFGDLNSGEERTVTIAYKVTDGTEVVTKEATLVVLGADDNRAPVAANDSLRVASLVPVVLNVLGNDSDLDGDELTIASVSATSNGGTVVKNADGTLTYIPKDTTGGYADTFTYTVEDGHGGSSTASVTVQVDPATELETAGKVYVSKKTDVALSVATLLANDGIAGNDGKTVVSANIYNADRKDKPIAVTLNDGTICFETGGLASGQDKGYLSLRFSDGSVVNYDLNFVNAENGEILKGEYVASYLSSDNGPDYLQGTSFLGFGGADAFFGGAGSDTLNGGAGDDLLVGGLGMDQLIGGSGADAFKFVSADDSSANSIFSDTIWDFCREEGDKIDLSQIDANTKQSGDQAFIFNESSNVWYWPSKFETGKLYFNKLTEMLGADVNGDNKADFMINVKGMSSLQASDFDL